MIKMMAVYDENPLYGARLADYVNQKGNFPFTAMAFTSLEQLEHYSREHEIEILLVSEASRSKTAGVKAKAVIMLCEGEFIDKKDEPAAVYKYQSGDCIMREVMESYRSYTVEPGLALLGKKAFVIGIYSPVNRCQKTALALTMGQVLSKELSVLYISLEEYSGLRKLLCQECSTDLSDVLYLYRQEDFSWMKLKSMVYSWGSLDYIAPVCYGEDLSQLEPQELAGFLERISRESGYDRLVVDVGNTGRGAAELLAACDIIYMPVKDDCISLAKLEEFEEYLVMAGRGALREKIQKVKLPCGRLTISRENYLEQLLWSELGDYVRHLLGSGG